ncbi:glycosyltransferase [Kaistella carnis]|uniref:Glycosyltransferase n=1 Tax=Kaistella carnis TaxID=1241979 RepID=A0A3G8XLD9_9FLAO|nr:glycosyltransferase [Kaistella carnis]AZI33343.1 glycosyltransferase [Kaistella carnis]
MSNDKIKILFRHRSLEMGGIEMVLLNILNYLDYNKYEVVLLLNYKQGEFLHRVPTEVKVLYIGQDSELSSENKYLNFIQKAKRRLKYAIFENYPKFFYKKHQLLDYDFEVAFSHYMLKDVYNSPNKKSKKIYWIHGDLRNSGFGVKQNNLFVELMQKFDTGIFVSNHGKNIVEKHWNVQLKNAQVIYNPLEIDQILAQAKEPAEEPFKNIDFISVGRLFSAKGFKDLVKAHNQLVCEGYKIKTAIIGEGIQRKDLEMLIEKYHIEDTFLLYGFSENPIKYIKESRYFVLPSYSESYPMVIGEALCLNKPVLSTNVGGISEMVQNNRNGLLFNPGKEELYKVIKLVLDNPSLEKILSKQDSLVELKEKNNRIFQQLDQLFQ